MAVHNCKYCKAECGFGGENRQRDCKGYITMTNADRIRAMSDEELVEVIMCPYGSEPDICRTQGTCIDCCEEWLKEPVEVE